ncbi:DUF2752 domain-containing protein [Vallitalea longa]|uniref:DUF2752 domain-containing protein n=1 Tax=Vallitalea longa TaxID=2936439 RepID=UPI0024922797|nr:DUF2752 domain-containing protein [Vallitalea longa]
MALIILISAFAYIEDDEVHLTDNILIGKCAIKEMTGHDCPSCGLTRSFVSISNGKIIDAVNYNVAGLLLYILVFSQIINSSIFLIKKRYNGYVSRFNMVFSLVICFIIIVNFLFSNLL